MNPGQKNSNNNDDENQETHPPQLNMSQEAPAPTEIAELEEDNNDQNQETNPLPLPVPVPAPALAPVPQDDPAPTGFGELEEDILSIILNMEYLETIRKMFGSGEHCFGYGTWTSSSEVTNASFAKVLQEFKDKITSNLAKELDPVLKICSDYRFKATEKLQGVLTDPKKDFHIFRWELVDI